MDVVPYDSLCADPRAFDRAVVASHRIDAYCSSSVWVLPAHAAFHPASEPLILRCDHGWAAIARGEAPSIGRYYAPLESMWGLACPLVGPSPVALARDVYRELHARRASWDTLWFGGLDRRSLLFRALVSLFSTTCSVRWGPTTRRYAASLTDGYAGWRARRTRKFRKNLRRDARRAEEAGVELQWVAPPPDGADALYARIQAIEARSWKGLAGAGIGDGGMRRFYDLALQRLVPAGALRTIIATRGGVDIGYIFGGVLGDTFRGLQASFDETCRPLSLGNVLQGAMISRLADEGVAIYDLGTEIEYKSRWAEPGLSTDTLVVLSK